MEETKESVPLIPYRMVIEDHDGDLYEVVVFINKNESLEEWFNHYKEMGFFVVNYGDKDTTLLNVNDAKTIVMKNISWKEVAEDWQSRNGS